METTVSVPPWERALVWIGFPPLGAVLGGLLDLLVRWMASLPGGPFHGAVKLADKLPEPHAAIGSIILGALAGLALAHQAAKERLTVTVSGDRVILARRGSVREIAAGSVSAVFRDGRRLVLLGPDTEELSREPCDLNTERLRAAFVAHGHPWHDDGDPHAGEYRRWVEATPDLPPGVNALLKARARALAKGERDDAADLRAELAEIGIVVRDEKKRQSWRRAGPISGH
ncbi:MAG TPA: hypothetical protein VFU43_28390 [Streptosporangiaceae bacterium]|nr:hypothetical protein [Streptosporangiaceae bacterium]